MPTANLRGNHADNCAQVDKPIAGLLHDLKQRGMLDETLVVWATEFGRSPGTEGADGRDHHPFGFSVWMAGGGIKGGVVHGATDELGFHAVENRHYVTDIHATVLHQLGLDSRRLEIPAASGWKWSTARDSRDHRLTRICCAVPEPCRHAVACLARNQPRRPGQLIGASDGISSISGSTSTSFVRKA